MKIRWQYPGLAWIAGLVVACGLILAAPATATTTYSGRASAAFVNTALTRPVSLSDTGELPPSGGFQSNPLLTATLAGVLILEVLVASTSGASGQANSSAPLANVTVLHGHAAQLTASFVRSETKVTCAGVQGSSQIANLTFGGKNIQVSGEPDQTVSIPGVATLIINEQTTTTQGTYREIRVNALHLTVPGVAEVILGHAKRDINR